MTKFNQTLFAVFAAIGLVLSSFAGATAARQDLPTIVVGSKDFTEQIIVSEMVALLLEDAGYPVERQLNLGGTVVAHEALVNGDIDVYVEYTGTGLLAILGLELPAAEATPAAGAATPVAVGVDPVYDIVAAEYQSQFGLTWLEPWGFNNTYALALRGDQATELGVVTISDLLDHDQDLVFGGTQEFLVREDGLVGLQEVYGVEFEDAIGFDPGLVYGAIESGDVDVISAFATDGRIPSLGLTLLEDDLGFFPPYYAAPVVSQEILDESPEVADILNQLSGMIDDQTMADLNFQVDDGGMEAIDVARAFLIEQGLITE
ncbi:MAG: glycine/betaine ABC transporter substrate-binding protein [Chloroflexia bacterium]|nr:glycine/betaine ABC transporter substrate-binding protein [Chloroflexia bacterium]